MASLEEHMSELGDHARLGYRADCAVCRIERENAHLPEAKLRSMRAQAASFALLMGVAGVAAAPVPAEAGTPPVPAGDRAEPGGAAQTGETVEIPVAPPTARPPGLPGVADSGARHVVRPGDTLAKIARSMLAPGASQEQVVLTVDRIWRLNSHRIASGDPGALAPGEILALPPADWPAAAR